MKVSLYNKKLRRIVAAVLSFVMIFGLLQSIPGGIFAVKAEAESDAITKVWNFRGGQDGAYDQKIEKKTGEFDGLLIDATTGKCAARTADKADTQINTGTKISVPVPADSTYTLTVYARAEFAPTVNGEAMAYEGKEIDNKWGGYYTYSGSTDSNTTYVTFVAGANKYLREVSVTYYSTPAPSQAGNGKIDIVDFGAEQFDAEVYNNLLTEDIANTFSYSGEPNSSKAGVNVLDFTIKDTEGKDFLTFCAGGKTNNRYRTTNTNINRYDDKNKKIGDTIFNGFIYSNNSSTDTVYMDFNLVANDELTLYIGSNGNAATYKMVAPDGKVTDLTYSGSNQLDEVKFYASVDGAYRLYCSNEKLVVARALREHKSPVKITGIATYDSKNSDTKAPSGYSLVFTNDKTGGVVEASVAEDGTYSAYLYDSYSYTVSLKNANGYVIASEASYKVDKESTKYNVTINPVEVITIKGNIKGLSSDALAKMNLKFVSDNVYVPEITVEKDGSYVLKAEANVKYSVVAENVNDYTLKTDSFVAADNGTADFTFEAKPVYPVKVNVEGLGNADISTAKVTFSNINEAGYVYTYGINDDIRLRDGQYSVTVSNLEQYAYVQKVATDVKINGAAGSTTVKYEAVSNYNFATIFKTNKIQSATDCSYLAGLKLTGNCANNKDTYLLANAGATVTIPNVKKGSVVTVNYCYSASFTIGDVVVDEKSGSTTKIDSKTYVADKDGDVVITLNEGENAKQTYFTAINVASSDVEYKDIIAVGSDKEYKTIGSAIEAIRKMPRTDEQSVTVMIDPGNYEEMLVIDTPNVVLKNASATPSIELTNKGVDIADNAVRITWYYGHGYTYYSMGNNCKFDQDILDANKSNGYASFKNPGSGTTNGSYWNATVVINADNVSADGIIFENSFNQYVSAASVNDVIEAQSGAKEDKKAPRADMKTVGDTTVQNKAYVERAAALAIYNNVDKVYFNNCKFIGRQDTLYGGTGVKAAFNKCSVYGGTDYIFGAMTAVFNKCSLVFNTSEDKNDVGYITAPQQSSGRGYLMYNCLVTSTKPGQDTASEYTSKPGYFGRPWQATTSEALFYNTIIEEADDNWSEADADGNKVKKSLIDPAGWLNSLGGTSDKIYEYNTTELAGVDNSASRVTWSKVLTETKLPDGTDISEDNLVKAFLGDEWNPFGKDASVVEPKVAAYNVEHYIAQADGTYKLDKTETLYGEIGAEAVAKANSYDGYKVNEKKSILKGKVVMPTVEDGKVKLLTLKVYYDSTTTKPSVVEPKVAAYDVEHYIAQADGTYKLGKTERLYGAIGAEVEATAGEYDGYKVNTDKSVLKGKVVMPTVKDEKVQLLTLKVYYDRTSEDVDSTVVVVKNDDVNISIKSDNIKLEPEEIKLIESGSVVEITSEYREEAVSEEVSKKFDTEVKNKLENATVGHFFELNLYMTIGNEVKKEITETKSDITVTVNMPEALINTDSNVNREYVIVREHEGVISIIPAVYDKDTKTLKFATDRFSTYAIAYVDKADNAEKPGESDVKPSAPSTENDATTSDNGNKDAATKADDSSVKTGDTAMTAVYVVLAILAAGMCGVAILDKKRRFN